LTTIGTGSDVVGAVALLHEIEIRCVE
jgi:hypothetical protein